MMGRQQRHATFDGEKAPKADVIGLQKLCKIADELSGLLHPALGVAGKGVMISQKSPREVTITKVNLCMNFQDATRMHKCNAAIFVERPRDIAGSARPRPPPC